MGMGNIIKYIKYEVSHITPDISEAEAKTYLNMKLNNFLEERILYARENIANFVSSTIKDGDVILTFGSSPLIRQVLLKVANIKKIEVIVVDTRPLNEGIQTLKVLSPYMKCIYTPLNGCMSVMKHSTRVLLGASSLLSNGSMLAPAGSAMIASIASNLRIPVIIAVESYKFSEKVQLDSIVYNELGSEYEIASHSGTPFLGNNTTGHTPNSTDSQASHTPQPTMDHNYRGQADKLTGGNYPETGGIGMGISTPTARLPFQVVNLRYDLTPIRNISVIATETGLIRK